MRLNSTFVFRFCLASAVLTLAPLRTSCADDTESFRPGWLPVNRLEPKTPADPKYNIQNADAFGLSSNKAALAISRWHREAPDCPERRGCTISNNGNAWTSGGDHGYGVSFSNQVWSQLADRSLTDDPAERLMAQEMLLHNLEDVELHQRTRKPPGDRLWSAKGEALATAVLQGTHPETGRPNYALHSSVEDTIGRQFNDAHYRHDDFGNGWAAQLLREYATLCNGRDLERPSTGNPQPNQTRTLQPRE